MADIIKRIEELMDLFDEDEVTTANKIQRPQSALDRQMFEDFKKRNPMSNGGRIGFRKGERADLQFENLTRKENAKRLKLPTTNALGYRALPNYQNITYTDYRDKKTGKKFRTYGVRIRRQDKKATTAATPRTGNFSNIPTLEEAIKVRDQFRKENPLNIKTADPKKAKITKEARRDFIKAQGGVEDFLTGEKGTGVQKGHAGDIKTRKITPSSIIYTPEEVNVGMAGKEGVKGAKETFTDLDYKISVAENEIEKIKKSNISPKEKRRLLDIQDRLLTDYHFQSGGFKTPTLSDGTVFGESTKKTMSMDPLDLFPNMTEKETRDFVRQYITEKGTLKPFYQRLVDSGEISEIDKENIRKSKLFLDNVELAKQNVKKFNVSNMKRLAAIGCPGKMMGGRITLAKGENLSRCAVRGINKLQTTEPKNLTLADRANYKAIRKTSQGARVLKNVLGPAALAIEALFVAPFAASDYASGRRGKDIALSALSLGLADQKLRRDELKEYFPEYGKGQALLDLDERLMELERQQKGTRGQRIRSKGILNINLKKFDEAIKELPTEESLLDNLEKSRQAEIDLAKDEAERKKRRISPFDFDPFSAAGGGIAKEAGDPSGAMLESMNPDSQGLPGLLKRGRRR